MLRIAPSVTFILVIAAGAAFVFFNPFSAATEKPQTPRPPFPYTVEEMKVETGGVTLAGTLTLPEGDTPAPAAILLSVAGPNDRDQHFAGHRSFAVMADALARNGVAAARFDDRGAGGSTGDYFEASWETLRDDAVSIYEAISRDPRIDPARIGFIGISEGAAVAAMAVNAIGEARFAILLSAPGLTGRDALALQLEKTLELSGVTGQRADQYRKLFDDYIDIVASDPASPETRARLTEFLEGPGAALIPPYSFVPKTVEGRVEMLLGPWYQSNVHFDPAPVYMAIDTPVLAIGGELDPVAPPEQHLAAIENYLARAPGRDVTVRIFPDVNHLMQSAKTGSPAEYAALENTLSDEVLDAINGWLGQRIGAQSE
ncbi:alpha/beta hydrolase family protein [Hyphococcus sp.]|uniref:alpha/beta hydrolase family protein n=1 Tax=Hyphococcus sp. TaxID=2038636 RepID=UPI003CCBFC2D